MSTKTVKICDIDNCGQLAMYTWKDFFYRVQGDMGYSYTLVHDVDLCSKHNFQYEQAMPLVHINSANAHRTHKEDIR